MVVSILVSPNPSWKGFPGQFRTLALPSIPSLDEASHKGDGLLVSENLNAENLQPVPVAEYSSRLAASAAVVRHKNAAVCTNVGPELSRRHGTSCWRAVSMNRAYRGTRIGV